MLKTNTLYFAGLILLVAGLPSSLFLISLSQFVLAGSFFLEGDFREKFRRFFSNKAALLFAGIWLMHVIGLLWTNDMHEALKDIRIKLPLLTLTLIIAGTEPLSTVRFRWLLTAFVASVFISSWISMAVLAGIIHRNIYDIRDIFIFHISHIRFALFTCLSIYITIWLAFRERRDVKTGMKILAVIVIAWFLAFLIIIESVTGLIILSATALILLLCQVFLSGSFKKKLSLLCVIILLPVCALITFKKIVSIYYSNHSYPINTTDKTSRGNYYFFNMENSLYENGYPIWAYVCEDEMRTSWDSLSKLPYDSLDERNQPLKFTLMRFLTSKGLRKDADAVNQLTAEERRSIERGVANVNYQDISSLNSRLLQIMWEFDQFIKGGNPSGHSVTQRFEFWKAAVGISKTNLFFGVGTGDMPHAYQEQYKIMNSSLDENHRLRAHNQYLAIMVAFGICGLLYFLIAMCYPVISLREKVGFLFAAFFLIAMLSMFSEDTLETQPGATFVGFFFALLLFRKR